MPPGHLFIFGYGYVAATLARRLVREGWRVSGTTRDTAKLSALRADRVQAHLFGPGGVRDAGHVLAEATHILCTAAPTEQGDPALVAHGEMLRSKMPQHLRWLGYVSTTGVYGDAGGAWVDEATPPRPGQPRSVERLASERTWQAFALDTGFALDIFRLPGIYGPGRSAVDQVKAGTARRIDKPGQVFSRIHVEDIAGTVLMALSQAHLPGIYNVADDLPAATADVVACACELLGRPLPPLLPWGEAQAAMSPMARSFYAENRRVRNERIKAELGVQLRYPTYREGLRAIASAG